jgi:hypothetical protein
MNWRHNAGSDITTVPSVGTPPLPPPGEPEPPAPSSRRNVVLGLILALIAMGLVAVLVQRANNNDDGGATAASSTPSTPSTPATSVSTGARVDQPPAIVNTGEDWDAIVRSMVAFSDWLYLHPNPDLLDRFQLPSVPGYADTKLGLSNLATKGWRYDPPRRPVTVEIVRLNNRGPAMAAVFVRFGPAQQYRVVDRAGNEVANKPATTVGSSVIWTLYMQPDGKWLLGDMDAL